MLNKLDAEWSFRQNEYRVRAQRQELSAARITNADTPNCKTHDLDFNSAIQQAISKNQAPNQATGNLEAAKNSSKTSDRHFNALPVTGFQLSSGPGEPLYRPIIQGSVDGNTVDMDVERNQFVDNGIRYEASLTMMNAQLKKMLAAIQGQ